MRNFLNPRWIFILNTLPTVALFVLLIGQFNIIKTLLTEENILLWKTYGSILGILGFLNFAYAVYLIFRKQNVSALYGMIALLSYVSFIYLYGYHIDQIIPFDIPQWMISGNIFLYAGTFLMPALIYSLFVLVVRLTPEAKEHKAWVNFFIAIGIPLAGYLSLQMMFSAFWQFDMHVALILIIAATLVFLFFLIRGIFILVTKKAAIWQEYQLIWKIPIAIILPLLGLLINNKGFSENDSGIFGNFTNCWFYILAGINGILICLPDPGNKLYRLILFIGRSITFAYTFYFFLVFLPFLPLSVIAIIAIGTGFLMLTPLLLFVIHVHELSKDFTWLKTWLSEKTIAGISFLSFLVIPALITATYLKDKHVLNKTLEYIYHPDYSKSYPVDKTSLQKTLQVIKHHKDRNNDFMSTRQTPYLSSWFNWLVLDNLTLSDSKINYMEEIFFGKMPVKITGIPTPGEVKITNISVSSNYDEVQMAWKSRVDLELTNQTANSRLVEYATTIDLPAGCWISDYYLYVGDRKEYGILAEKKSAVWVFSNIRNQNRDPGILYYQTGNKVTFRVFPFLENETRKTGIEFLHKEPLCIKFDDEQVLLGNWEKTFIGTVETENVAYVSIEQKKFLKRVQRKPYFHFLVDVSKGKNEYSADFTKRIETLRTCHKPLVENAQISFVNSYVNTYPFDDNWQQNYQSQTFDGGFYLDRAIRTVLFNACKNKSSYPVIVVVTDNFNCAVLDKGFSDFAFAFPESDRYFYLGNNRTWQIHSLSSHYAEAPFEDIDLYRSFDDRLVLEYKPADRPAVYVPNDSNPSIILKKDIFETGETEIKEKNWQSALTMQGKWMSQVLHPETSEKEGLRLIEYSFLSKVMTPLTSYLVVENEAQKAILKKKQEQVLSSNSSLDLSEDTLRMSEPDLWILIILLGLYKLSCKLIKQQKRQQSYFQTTGVSFRAQDGI